MPYVIRPIPKNEGRPAGEARRGNHRGRVDVRRGGEAPVRQRRGARRPRYLTQAVVAQKHAVGRLRAGVAVGHHEREAVRRRVEADVLVDAVVRVVGVLRAVSARDAAIDALGLR